jgi:hypothetical protein
MQNSCPVRGCDANLFPCASRRLHFSDLNLHYNIGRFLEIATKNAVDLVDGYLVGKKVDESVTIGQLVMYIAADDDRGMLICVKNNDGARHARSVSL